MEKKIIIFGTMVSLAIGSYFAFTNNNVKDNNLTSRNIEALSNGEGPSMMGCKYARKSSCYVFDGGGMMVGNEKNRYPGSN